MVALLIEAGENLSAIKNALDIQVTKLLLPYMGMSPKN